MPLIRFVAIRTLILTVPLLVAQALPPAAWAGGAFFRNGAVGGISINAEGIVAQPTVEATRRLHELMLEALQPVDNELEQSVPMRCVSLRRLSEALDDAVRNRDGELDDDVRYLAGLQRVQYVFVYPEQKDIVLAGPGEGWTVTDSGTVVGKTTGQPVVLLEDLLVALRTVQAARDVGLTCSIDPRTEGIRRMQELMQQQPPVTQGSNQVRLVLDAIEKAMGPQDITLTGVPETSHFARVLVAADYHMKRIAMDLQPSPLRSLPSFLDMMSNSRVRVTNMMPRWWLACNYQPLARSDDGLAWELRGPGVQAMTEDDFVARSGAREATGRKNPLAVRWAEAMTTNFTDLATHQPVFGQLRNLMDLCVVAAVIEREDLVQRAGCDLSLLTRADSDLSLQTWNPPKTVATQCSFAKRGREYLITASGGVRIDSWQAAEQSQVEPQVGDKRAAVAPAAAQQSSWRWN